MARFVVVASLLVGVRSELAHGEEPEASKPAETSKLDNYGDPLPPGALARFGTIRLRHDAKAVAFLNDKTIVSVGSSIRFWDVATGRLLRVHRQEQMTPPKAAAISGDGKRAITLSWDRTVRVWDIPSGRLVREFKKEADKAKQFEIGASILPSADGSRFLTVEADVPAGWSHYFATIYALDSRSEPVVLRTGADTINSCAISPDGKQLVFAVVKSAGSPDQRSLLEYRDPDSGKLIRIDEPKTGTIHEIGFLPDGQSLVLSGDESLAIRTTDGKTLWRQAGGAIGSFLLHVDARQLVLLAPKLEPQQFELRVFGADTGKLLRHWPLHHNVASTGGVSPDGTKSAVAIDKQIRIFNLHDGSEVASATGPSKTQRKICVTPDGRFVASITWEDGVVLLWDAATGKLLRTILGNFSSCCSIAFSSDSRMLACSGYGGGILVWDIATGRQLHSLPDQLAGDMRFLPDNKRLVHSRWSAGGGVAVQECVSGQLVREMPGPFPTISCESLGFRPDGRPLAAYSSFFIGGNENYRLAAIDIWDVLSGGLVQHFSDCPNGEFCTNWSGDGRMFAARFNNGTIRLWEMTTGQQRLSIREPDSEAGRSSQGCRFALSPDGRSLAAIGRHQASVDLWDLASGNRFGSIAAYDQPIETVDFSPDGRRLYTAHGDSTIMAWDMTQPEWRSRTLTHQLSDEDLTRHWDRLRNSNAEGAYRSKWALAADPEKSVAFLTGRVLFKPQISPDRIKTLIADLDSAEYRVRDRAQRELEEHFHQAEAMLRKTLAGRISSEMRSRVNRMIDANDAATPSPNQLRDLRAVEVIEHIGTSEARDALRRLAGSDIPRRIARDAAESLKRLEAKPQ